MEEIFLILFHVRILFPFIVLFLFLCVFYPFIRNISIFHTRLFLKISNTIVAFSAVIPAVFISTYYGVFDANRMLKFYLLGAPDIPASALLGTISASISHNLEAVQKKVVPLVFLSAIFGGVWSFIVTNWVGF